MPVLLYLSVEYSFFVCGSFFALAVKQKKTHQIKISTGPTKISLKRGDTVSWKKIETLLRTL